MNSVYTKAVSFLVLATFAFALGISIHTEAFAEQPPPYLICCSETGWCQSDEDLMKAGWNDFKVPGSCYYTANAERPECIIFVPTCPEY